MKTNEGDYILGTHEEELRRLGLQHRVWRPVVLRCWQRAGINVGHRVLDVGAGPGYATADLAEIVGPSGSVAAAERSAAFLSAIRQTCELRHLTNVSVHEIDLMRDELPGGGYDFAWCRWVACFVPDPPMLMRKIVSALRPGGRAVFHEYGHYQTWQFSPRLPGQEKFVDHVMESWRETGSKADIGLDLPPLLVESGCRILHIVPHIFCVTPRDYMWQWPATFMQTGPARLQELGRFDQAFTDQLLSEFAAAEANPNTIMVTPLVLEIVAEKL
jgi:SAM-dependent methyltransferase